tara:strand:+ start:184 stop:663 length:480 start_codon:yes stop_codon:yes gene_type:complete
MSPLTALFAHGSDEWSTPAQLYAELDREFGFTLDAAASAQNTQSPTYLTQWQDARLQDWATVPSHRPGPVVAYLNPPYSKIRSFMAKAVDEVRVGCTVVCLVPARTDTRWWHDAVWDTDRQQARDGVEVRFLRGRLTFNDGAGSAPFPSVVVILRPVTR